MRNTVILVLASVIVAIATIGLFNFDLMIEIWVKILIGVLFAGSVVTIIRQAIRQKGN
jgi:hypothetical protein